jgi:hypothetical protein
MIVWGSAPHEPCQHPRRREDECVTGMQTAVRLPERHCLQEIGPRFGDVEPRSADDRQEQLGSLCPVKRMRLTELVTFRGATANVPNLRHCFGMPSDSVMAGSIVFRVPLQRRVSPSFREMPGSIQYMREYLVVRSARSWLLAIGSDSLKKVTAAAVRLWIVSMELWACSFA